MSKTVQCVMVTLPPPISANAIWRSHISRSGKLQAIKSAKYRDWITLASTMIMSQRVGRIEGAYGLRIQVPRKSRVDLDNVIKPINDLAQMLGIIENDRLCQNISVEKSDGDETIVWFISTKAKGENDVSAFSDCETWEDL